MGRSCWERNMVNNYIPKQKDILFVNLNPTKGHEQSGYRPVIVISNNVFNKFTKMIIVLPITSNTKDFPTHYVIQKSKKIQGSVLCEHVRSIDYENRDIKYIEKCHIDDFDNIICLMNACIKE